MGKCEGAKPRRIQNMVLRDLMKYKTFKRKNFKINISVEFRESFKGKVINVKHKVKNR